MKQFNTHREIKETYDGGKFDIYYKNGDTTYEVKHLGSTVYCHNTDENMGMGAITNFNVDGFYAIERPVTELENAINEEDYEC